MGTIAFARTPHAPPVPRSTCRLSFLTLQRGNALRDAPRHRSAPHRIRSPECRQRIGMSEILA
ncbi:hypothetical protein B0F86_21220 [Pseudomonas syringae]|nr:hypothetical protein B0F86_21220 [Pseudomonas syringae]RXT62533.1 hypothetical protein B1F74_17395 [Pseudomonas syringae]